MGLHPLEKILRAPMVAGVRPSWHRQTRDTNLPNALSDRKPMHNINHKLRAVKYVTLFWAIFYPLPPVTLRHTFRDPPKVRHTSRTPPFLEGLVHKTGTKT